MNHYKKLLSTTIVFAVSQFASKLLNFFLLPLYTAYLSPGDYGTGDLINSTVINLLVPVMTLMIASSVLRFTIDKNRDGTETFKIGFFVTAAGCILMACFLPVVAIPYKALFYFTYVVYSFDLFWDNFAKGIDRIKTIAVGGVLKTFLAVLFNLYFLVHLNTGVEGYLLSYILALFISHMFIAFRIRFWKYMDRRPLDRGLFSDMLKYCIPLIPGNMSWWLNGTVNKYILAGFSGTAVLGVFSAASKIPGAVSAVQGFFSQALVLTVIGSYHEEKEGRDQFYTELFYIYNFIMTATVSALIVSTKGFARILFADEFYAAWRCVPFLLLGSMFGALSGYLGTFYSASMETKGIFTSTLAGAVLSVVLNLLLVPFSGGEGASCANAISTGVIFLIRLIETRKYVKLKLNLACVGFSYGILIIQAVILMIMKRQDLLYLCESVLFIFIIAVNRRGILSVLRKIINI